MTRIHPLILALCALLIVAGCADSSDESLSYGSTDDHPMSGGNDASFDNDDRFLAIDGDADADFAGDTDDWVAPETEERFDYRVPHSSGPFVFIPDQANDTVIAVDSESLRIYLTHVGSQPSHLVALDDEGSVAVLAHGSSEVSIIRMDKGGTATIETVTVRPDTNALAVSNSGRFVIAFWDALFENEGGPPGTDQEITLIDTTKGAETTYHMSIGTRPMKMVFNEDDTRAFAITHSGINIINLEDPSLTPMPPSVSLFDYTQVSPTETEVAIAPDGSVAMGRENQSETVVFALLDGSKTTASYTLASVPTDLDVDPLGRYGLFTLRETEQVAMFDLPFDIEAETPFTYIDMASSTCGQAHIADTGNKIAFYTSVGTTSHQQVLTIMTLDNDTAVIESGLLARPIHSVLFTADGASLVARHATVSASSLNAEELPYAYSLVKTEGIQSKFQQISADFTQFLLLPDQDYAYILSETDSIEVINLRNFIVDTLRLGSVPVAAGFAPTTGKVFISQNHPSGRMTFMDVDASNIKTVTGYTLNNQTTN